MARRNRVYKEARLISMIIGVFGLMGVVGGAYEWLENNSDIGCIVAFISLFILLVAYIGQMVANIGENTESLRTTESIKTIEKKSDNQ